MILSAKFTGRVPRLHGSRRGARTRTANGSHDQLVAMISLPMAVYGASRPLALVLAKAPSPNRERSLGLGRGNRAISSTSFC
jgi:hypothetical protein